MLISNLNSTSGFAMTWGPTVWAIVAELYPSRYRAELALELPHWLLHSVYYRRY